MKLSKSGFYRKKRNITLRNRNFEMRPLRNSLNLARLWCSDCIRTEKNHDFCRQRDENPIYCKDIRLEMQCFENINDFTAFNLIYGLSWTYLG